MFIPIYIFFLIFRNVVMSFLNTDYLIFYLFIDPILKIFNLVVKDLS